MTVWVFRTADGRPHWTSEWRYAQGNREITRVETEEHAAMMRDVFAMTTDEWCNMRVNAGLPMYPPKPAQSDDRFRQAVDEFSVAAVRAVTPGRRY